MGIYPNAKETLYNGYKFRSKLEAKWAVFFDKLGIPYQYEPDALLCEDGSQYTPDFYLPLATLRGKQYMAGGLTIEIKPFEWERDSDYLHRITSAIPAANFVLFCGEPMDAIEANTSNGNEQLAPWWDNWMGFMVCDCCGKVKADFWEYVRCGFCNSYTNGEKVVAAAEYARKYQFVFNNQVTRSK
jgi:hypothetical protein